MTSSPAASSGSVEVSLRSPPSPGFARKLFPSTAAAMSPLPSTAALRGSMSPRSTPARSSAAVLRAELHRSLWSDSPATAPVPSVALPLPSSHAAAARRAGPGGVQRRLAFDSAADFHKSLPTPTLPLPLASPFDTLPANDKLSLPPLVGAAQPFSQSITPSSLLPDTVADSFLHASPFLPPRPTPHTSPHLSSLPVSSGHYCRLPPSPCMLPVPDFTLHDVNQRRSPMRPQRIRERPECPETPTRVNKRQQLVGEQPNNQPVTLFQYSARASRPDGDDELMTSGKNEVRQRVRADSLADETDGEADELSGDELTDTSSLTSPTCSPMPTPPRLSLQPTLLSMDSRLDQFELEEEVGSGSFSRVWRAKKRTADSPLNAIRDDGDTKHYAVISSKQPVVSKRDKERFLRHSQHLLLLASPPTPPPSTLLPPSPSSSSLLLSHPSADWHPCILRHYALWHENGYVHALTDYYAMGDVRTFFSSEKRPESYVWQLLYDMATALQHLAALQLLHFDVKPSNILVTPAHHPPTPTPTLTQACPYHFVLADLGSLVTYSELTTASDLHEGDGHFLAPEVLSSPKSSLTSAVDVFALGRSGLACLTGELQGEAVGAGVLSGLGVSRQLCECLCGMVEQRVEKRLTLAEVVARAQQFV